MSSSVPPPSSGFQRPPSPGRDLYEERGAGFSRAGFAPIPQRHQEVPAAEPSRDVPDPARGRRPSWGDRRDELDDGARVGGRGRDEFDRRPPPPRGWDEYDDRPKRRRSPSPFGSSHRPRRHSPSPSRPPISNLPDPAEVPNLLPFRQFADWFRASHPQTAKADEEELIKWREAVEAGQDAGSKDKVGMGKRYERYRKEFHSRQLYTLYLTHRETPWFQEKYSNRPEMIALRRRLNRQGRVPTAEKYLDALRAGDYNTLSFDMTSETDKRSSGGRRNSELEESEGMDRALGDNHADDPLRVEVPPSDRQVFVKTVPPMTSRQELEAMFKRVDGFEYLAITEPAAKKSFHRVAWAQYREGVNVEDVVKQLNGAKIDTFTFHMGVNATSVIGRIRVTAPVSNSLERLLKDGEKAKELAIKLEEDLMGDDEEDAKKAENEGDGKAKTEGDGDKAADETKEASYPGLREQGSVVVQEKIDALLEDEGLSGDLNEERQTIRAKMVLDQWLSYLRHGLSTCYYCVASLPFPEELHRKCVSHLRPHPTTPTEQSLEAVPEGGEANESAETQEEKVRQHDEDDEDRRDADPDKAVAERKSSRDRDRRGGPSSKVQDERWEEGIDSKLKPLLESVDVAEYGGRDIEEETKKVSAPFIKQEEASKYRCKECTKLFKAPEFVLKHISVKHPEVIKAKLEDLPTLNNFVLDPQRLQPVPSTPAAVNDQIPAPALPMMPGGMASLPQMPTFNPAFAGGPGFGGGNGSNMNMMQQQMMMMMQMQQAMMMGMNGMGNGGGGGGRGGLGDRIGGYGPGGPAMSAPLPAPPPGGEDPRAKRGRVSYMDLDEPGGGGGGGLPY